MKTTPQLIMFLARAFFARGQFKPHDTPCYHLLKRITPKTLPLP